HPDHRGRRAARSQRYPRAPLVCRRQLLGDRLHPRLPSRLQDQPRRDRRVGRAVLRHRGVRGGADPALPPARQQVRYMTLSVALFYSYRSPYSYLALPRTMQLVADYDVTVNVRPVYPLAVRQPDFFKKTNPKFARYVALDATRVAKRENI